MIVVLEDMDVRVQWLMRMFPDTNVRWAETVTDFHEAIAEAGDALQLVILDHDLGPGSLVSEDADGYTGMDAATDLRTTAPVIVWSINPVGAPAMVDTLIESGHDAVWISFWEKHFPILAAQILKAITRGKS